MKTLISIFTVLLCINSHSKAQTLNFPLLKNDPSINVKCGTDLVHKKMMTENDDYRNKMQEFEKYVQSHKNDISLREDNSTIVVPIVVHVMSTGTSLTDITEQQIKEAIRILNESYSQMLYNTNDSTNNGGVGIEFALAVRDPKGECTNGITYTDMTNNKPYMNYGVKADRSFGISDLDLKNIIRWNPSRYYNMWLVSEIDNNEGGAGILGYAYFASAHATVLDGAVMLVNTIKDPLSTTLAHELGHAFNLYHTFEGDNGGKDCPKDDNCSTDGDMVCDTPPHKRDECRTTECSTSLDINNSLNNFMSYCNTGLKGLFTPGQKERVIAAMNTLRISFLETKSNLSLVPAKIAEPDFFTTNSTACQGNPVQFFDNSACIPNTFTPTGQRSDVSFLWTVSNGKETLTSTLQNPLFTFNYTGAYDVTLQVANNFGTSSTSKKDFIAVVEAPIANACTPISTNVGYTASINRVIFNTIDKISGNFNEGYQDFYCTNSTTLTPGNSYQLKIPIRSYSSNTEQVQAYIDFNNNGIFEINELVLTGKGTYNETKVTFDTLRSEIHVPQTGIVFNQKLRMRIIGESTPSEINNKRLTCETPFFLADIQDFGVFIESEECPTTITPTFTQIDDICKGESFTLSNVSDNGINGTWTPAINTQATTVYTFTPDENQCASSVTMTVNVLEANLDANIVVSNNSLSVKEQDATYSWIDCNSGNVIENEHSTDFTPTKNGTYQVQITSITCPDISVSSECIPFITTSIADKDFLKILIYPNPAKETIRIENTKEFGIITLRIRDINGRIIQSYEDLKNYDMNIHIDKYSQGVYFIEIITNENSYTKRFIKL
ncbi:MAG: M43 family zinc metalloprotease [Chitinophagales bacterium]|nr:M43 family zinc metalloprotease [Chitinophagales bacterium]